MIWGRGLGAIALALLAGCGTGAPVDLRSTLTRAQLDTVETPLLLADIERPAAQATLIPWGENRGVVTWRTGDGVSLSFQDGVLTATRGLGFDLMSADAAATRAALVGGAAENYERFVTLRDGEGRTVFRTMICSMQAGVPERIVTIGLAVETRRYNERCRSTTSDVANVYWVGGDGTMWRARQWVGPNVGYLVTELLVQ